MEGLLAAPDINLIVTLKAIMIIQTNNEVKILSVPVVQLS